MTVSTWPAAERFAEAGHAFDTVETSAQPFLFERFAGPEAVDRPTV